MCDRNIKYRLPFLSKSRSVIKVMHTLLMWFGPCESWDPPTARVTSSAHWNSLDKLTLRPFTDRLCDLCDHPGSTLSLAAPLWELSAFNRIQIFMRTAANPKQKFTSGIKGYANKAHPSPRVEEISCVWWCRHYFCLGVRNDLQSYSWEWTTKSRKSIWRANHKFPSLPCPLRTNLANLQSC